MSRVTKAIILAAGRSTRYGKNKLVDPILGKSTIEYCIEFCMQEVGMRYLRPMGKPILLRPVGKPIGDYCEAQVAMNV